MDAVITYVDGNDPVWKRDYERTTDVSIMQKRFRDWGTLKYLLRGIEKQMTFIRNVYLVVSHPSQVPQWVDQSELKIVMHSDIIPEKFLPTFNCNPIEMHLHRIPGLEEEYLYFNDDLFPLLPFRREDFFRDGKVVMGCSRHILSTNMYKKICRNSDRLARRAAGVKPSLTFIRPQHICMPMLKSSCTELYDRFSDEIAETSGHRTRTAGDLNQYMFLDYLYYSGKVVDERIPNKHFSAATATAESLSRFILNPTRKIMCINDVRLSEKKFLSLQNAAIESLEIRFPDKSRFEL